MENPNAVNGREAEALGRILSEIDRLGLNQHLAELNSQGYTIIPQVLSESVVEEAKQAILNKVNSDHDKDLDLVNATQDDWEGQLYLPYLLYEDPVFESILLEPKPLALITYLLGESCVLSSMGSHFKGPGGYELPLHSDNGNGMPSPFPTYSQVANVNYALTSYSKEAGALAVVPLSHNLARAPVLQEVSLHGDYANPKAIALNLNPGDAVVWHGNTWHGSYRREIPGIRMNLAVYFARQYVQTQEQHKGVVPEAFAARHANNERMNILLGGKQPYGWRQEGPDYSKMAQNPRGLYD